MPDLTFNTVAGQTIAREMLVVYLNTGTFQTPVWSPLGKRVEDSDVSYDWQSETRNDILGATYTNMRKPQITESFDPWDLDGGDVALVKLWNLAIKDQDVQALSAQDLLLVHLYAGTADTAMFAERYPSSAVEMTRLGGEGGGNVTGGVNVTFGGTRTTGTAAISNGTVTFTAAA